LSNLITDYSNFNFGKFIEYLRNIGYIITIDHYYKLNILLNRYGQKRQLSKLKFILCPIFATNTEQQINFYYAFDTFFNKKYEIPIEKNNAHIEKKDKEPLEKIVKFATKAFYRNPLPILQSKTFFQKQKGKKLYLEKKNLDSNFSFICVRIDNPIKTILKSRQFHKVTSQLKNPFQSEEMCKNDIISIISDSINQTGLIKPIQITQNPKYLVLIDLPEYNNPFPQLAIQIIDLLKKADIFIVRYYYRNDPKKCFVKTSDKREYLTNIHHQHKNFRLIIVGTGDKFGYENSWFKDFYNWPQRAILSPKPTELWGKHEQNLSKHFLVLPATLSGIESLAIQLSSGFERNPYKIFYTNNSYQSVPENIIDVNKLKSHINDDEIFQWLCACSVFPDLHIYLTLYLGIKIYKKIKDNQLLSLIHLPWFKEGRIPEKLRLELINNLNKENERIVREAILSLIENSNFQEHFEPALVIKIAYQKGTINPMMMNKQIVGFIEEKEQFGDDFYHISFR